MLNVNEVRVLTPFTSNDTWEARRSSIAAAIFGQLVEACEGVVTHYRSDLFHDATMLEAMTKDCKGAGFTFQYLVRPWGTNMATDVAPMANTCNEDERLYLVEFAPFARDEGTFVSHQIIVRRVA